MVWQEIVENFKRLFPGVYDRMINMSNPINKKYNVAITKQVRLRKLFMLFLILHYMLSTNLELLPDDFIGEHFRPSLRQTRPRARVIFI